MTPTEAALQQEANDIVIALAEWSERYPPSGYYQLGHISHTGMYALEKRAKAYLAGVNAVLSHGQWSRQPEGIEWCKGYEKATMKLYPIIKQLRSRIKELESTAPVQPQKEEEEIGSAKQWENTAYEVGEQLQQAQQIIDGLKKSQASIHQLYVEMTKKRGEALEQLAINRQDHARTWEAAKGYVMTAKGLDKEDYLNKHFPQ